MPWATDNSGGAAVGGGAMPPQISGIPGDSAGFGGPVIKLKKIADGPFQSGHALVHTPRTADFVPVAFSGSLRTGIDRRTSVGRDRFVLRLPEGLARGGAAR